MFIFVGYTISSMPRTFFVVRVFGYVSEGMLEKIHNRTIKSNNRSIPQCDVATTSNFRQSFPCTQITCFMIVLNFNSKFCVINYVNILFIYSRFNIN